MQIRQLMKEAPESIDPKESVEAAARRMKQVDCGILPVKLAGQAGPLGTITDRDIAMRCVANGENPARMTVEQCMTSPAVCCDLDCSAEDAFHTMRDHKIGRLLVLDERGALAGIVSLADLIARVPSEIWNQLPGASRPQPRKAA